MQVTPGGQELSAKFKAAATAGLHSEAFSHLQGLCLLDALISCLELADTGGKVFDNLAQKAVAKGPAQFSVQLVKGGSMPQGPFSIKTLGHTTTALDDWDTARIFILRVRSEKSNLANRLWGQASAVAASACFYPEFVTQCPDVRKRICTLANAHVGLGPHQDQQVALFSLGGKYNYSQADAGTKPVGTTCILVARGVWHAAGCNVIWNGMSAMCNVPEGLKNLKQSEFGFVPASQYDKGVRPGPGDIFWIQGDPFGNKKGDKIDSTHVGLVIEVKDDVWTVVQGGAPDHITTSKTPKLIRVANNAHGKWSFDSDNVSCGKRPLQGWYSVDNIIGNKWMAGC
jgi:hypothetical protein